VRLGVLFSGGKDSVYAMYKAMQEHDIVCLITVVSKNPESFMFHTPNIELTEIQSKALDIPIISIVSSGIKEKELDDLKEVINRTIKKFNIDGIVTGSVESVYQSTRIQKICNELNIWCFNPIWLIDQIDLLEKMVEKGFRIIITGVFAQPFDKKWLGREIDYETIQDLKDLANKYDINPAGEGGEIETFVIDGPIFKKKIEILKTNKEYSDYSGTLLIEKLKVVEK